MFRRPGDDAQNDHHDELEQAVSSKLRELLAKKKEQDLEGASERTRGHATRVLRPRLSELREMVVYGLSMREMTDLLAEGGVQVNYHSLRGFLKKHLPREYAEYLETKKPFNNPNWGEELSEESLARDTPPEFKADSGTPKSTPAIENKPADESQKLQQLQMVEREVSATTDDAAAWDLIASRLPWLAEKVKENRVKSYINARMFISSETKSLETSLRLK